MEGTIEAVKRAIETVEQADKEAAGAIELEIHIIIY